MPILAILLLQELSLVAMLGMLLIVTSAFVYQINWSKYVGFALIVSLFFSVEMPLFSGAAMSLPGEPLVVFLAAIGCYSLLNNFSADVADFKSQPLVWAVGSLILVWVLTTVLSTMAVVSTKYIAVNLVYILVAVYLFPKFYSSKEISLISILRILSYASLFFAVYAIINLLPYRFNPGAAAEIALPFFKDHTIFSATLSLLIPTFLLWRFIVKSPEKKDWLQPAVGMLLLVVLVISTSRAAWLSIIVAGGIFVFIKLNGGIKTILLFIVVSVSLVIWNWKSIESQLLINPYTSTSAEGGLQEQVLSVTNLSSDISNKERLNRWKSALRMASDKPFTGFGPGTYQFQYLPYQRESEMTYISVTNPFNTIVGRGGSAHSEYLLLLSESGIFGLLAWIGVQVALIISFLRIHRSRLSSQEKYLGLALFLGCITFTVHSLFNNYLNTVQFGITWWLLVGGLLFLAIKARKEEHAG